MQSAALLFSTILALSSAPAWALVESPWLTSDRTVDCSTNETILRDVLKPNMKDEEKAIALFNFFRQRVYHYVNISESRDPLMTLNTIGNTLCGSQGTCMKGLLMAAGIKARVVHHTGHTFYEAFYDNQWHGFDTFTNLYIFTKGDKPHIASYDELTANPSLIDNAEKEGRSPKGMCMCGDDPKAFAEKIDTSSDYEPLKLAWSVKDLSLRSGEELVRSWWPHGKPLPGTWNPALGPGPLHTCGGHDRGDNPDLFKFWEPYGITKFSPNMSISYRHYFNGFLNYSPNLTNADYKDGLVSEKGVKPGPEGLSGAGELVIPVKCPYYISGADLSFEATCPGAGDAVGVEASADGKAWTAVLEAKDTGKKEYKASFDKIAVKTEPGLHAYQVKLTLKGKATLNRFFLQTTFTHNAMAAPHLMPGKNTYTLAAGKPESLKASPVTVVFRYKDAPAGKGATKDCTDWKGEVKTVEKKSDASPFKFEVAVPETDKLPQMQDLTLRCGTLFWKPDTTPAPLLTSAK